MIDRPYAAACAGLTILVCALFVLLTGRDEVRMTAGNLADRVFVERLPDVTSTIDLMSIDYGTGTIRYEFAVAAATRDSGLVAATLALPQSTWEVARSTLQDSVRFYFDGPERPGVYVTLLDLIRDPAHRPDVYGRIGSIADPDSCAFSADTTLVFQTDTRLFPFDSIGLHFESVVLLGVPGSPAPRVLRVRNLIPDYALYVGPERGSIVLRREPYLILLTLLVIALTIVSAITIRRAPERQGRGGTLLALFGSSWFARDVILGPLQGVRPFATVIDYAILLAFGLAMLAVVVPRPTPTRPTRALE